MRIGNCELEYFIDYLNRKIHLLDLDKSGMRSLMNSIDPTFQKRFVHQENLLRDTLDFDWLCYGTDGIVAEYKNYNFKYVNNEDQHLHEPFVKKMRERKGLWER